MTTSVQVLERIARRAAFGLRLWDLAGATHLMDGLEINVTLRGRRGLAKRAAVNCSGIYYALDLPGLCDFELSDDDAEDDAAWSSALRAYRVEIRDPQGRFLPLAFDADLPMRGLFDQLMPGTSPAPALPMIGSPPALLIEGVPLFSTPSRPAPGLLANVRAQVRELGTKRPAAWSLLAASIDGRVQGLGLADDKGRVAVLFPYPQPPRPTLVASPPPARNDFRWNVELTAYYTPHPPDVPAPEIPDLADVLAQWNSPRTLFHATTSPPQELSALQLEYGVPLTVRTADSASGPSSYLYIDAA